VLVLLQFLIALLFALSIYLGEHYAPDEMKSLASEIQQSADNAIAVHADGSFWAVAELRWRDWLGMLQFVLPLQGPGVFAFFLLGLAAVRAGVLSDASAPLWAKSRRIYLPIGIGLSAVGAYIYLISSGPISSGGLLSYGLLLLAAPFSSLGYIGLIAKWSEGPVTSVKGFVARGGTASLTAYLLQSALVVGVFTIVFASVWRSRFKYGPMEVLLRRWTYLAQQR